MTVRTAGVGVAVVCVRRELEGRRELVEGGERRVRGHDLESGRFDLEELAHDVLGVDADARAVRLSRAARLHVDPVEINEARARRVHGPPGIDHRLHIDGERLRVLRPLQIARRLEVDDLGYDVLRDAVPRNRIRRPAQWEPKILVSLVAERRGLARHARERRHEEVLLHFEAG